MRPIQKKTIVEREFFWEVRMPGYHSALTSSRNVVTANRPPCFAPSAKKPKRFGRGAFFKHRADKTSFPRETARSNLHTSSKGVSTQRKGIQRPPLPQARLAARVTLAFSSRPNFRHIGQPSSVSERVRPGWVGFLFTQVLSIGYQTRLSVLRRGDGDEGKNESCLAGMRALHGKCASWPRYPSAGADAGYQ